MFQHSMRDGFRWERAGRPTYARQAEHPAARRMDCPDPQIYENWQIVSICQLFYAITPLRIVCFWGRGVRDQLSWISYSQAVVHLVHSPSSGNSRGICTVASASTGIGSLWCRKMDSPSSLKNSLRTDREKR